MTSLPPVIVRFIADFNVLSDKEKGILIKVILNENAS